MNDLEAKGASINELDDAFAHVEALDQYDEGGAIVRMSAHERALACGHLDPEFSADDLPEEVHYLASVLRRAYVDGVEIEIIWDEINAQLELIFPVSVNQRERLLSEPLSANAYKLIKEIDTASEKKLGYLAWAMYGDNQPTHLFMRSTRGSRHLFGKL